MKKVGIIRQVKNFILGIVRGYNTPEQLRKRGAVIGNDVELWTSKIDKSRAYLLEIGNNVIISDARILLHDASTKIGIGYVKVGKVIIGNDVFIGADAIILPGVHIGNRVIVGAGSVVTKDIPDNSIAAGVPARVIEKYDDYVLKHKSLMKSLPKFEIYWPNKTDAEIENMKKKLQDAMGYDI
ncbi:MULTISPECIES: acyltransferase [unclassified Lacrimispora]|uniref:acyltransferase n=1 Tax=unclassified Lacrimispora TaxID=2719232 RepID=UPI00376F6016